MHDFDPVFTPMPHDHEAGGSQSHDWTHDATASFFETPTPATHPEDIQEDTIGDDTLGPRIRRSPDRFTPSQYP